MTTIKTAKSLTYHTMPRDGGQIIAVSYACDECGIYRRTHDQSDNSVRYDFAPHDDSDDAFEPWNGCIGGHGEWQPVK